MTQKPSSIYVIADLVDCGWNKIKYPSDDGKIIETIIRNILVLFGRRNKEGKVENRFRRLGISYKPLSEFTTFFKIFNKNGIPEKSDF